MVFLRRLNSGSCKLFIILFLLGGMLTCSYWEEPDLICYKLLNAHVISNEKLSVANSENLQGNLDNAIQLLKAGLASLSNQYGSDNVIDDSGMHLVLAEQAEISGDLVVAFRIYRRVLENRILLMKERLDNVNCENKG